MEWVNYMLSKELIAHLEMMSLNEAIDTKIDQEKKETYLEDPSKIEVKINRRHCMGRSGKPEA